MERTGNEASEPLGHNCCLKVLLCWLVSMATMHNMHDLSFAAPPWLRAIQLTLKGTTSLIPKPSGAGKGLRTKLYIVEPLGQNYCMKAVITLLVGWFPWQLCWIICYQAATHCGLLVVVSVVGGDTVEKRSPSSSSRNPSDFTCVFVGSGCFSFGL